ncbi:MAG: DUF1641 domain-containing protein [Actinomycetota bacterium]|nr:DUF1641 domain-containing protein [Actinomycetota bacterium]
MSANAPVTSNEPLEAVVERLNDPTVAASLVTLLDNAELLSTLVLGLSGMLERGDTIIDSVAAGVNEMKAATLADGVENLPTPAELTALTAALARATPVITEVLDSSMVSSDTVTLLSVISESAQEGAARARSAETPVFGVRDAVRAFRDPDVGRGLGLLVEISRSLGRRIDQLPGGRP